MKKQKFLFIIGFFREIFHTTFFVYFALLLLPRDQIWLRLNISFILLLAAGYLIIPAGYLLLLYNDTKFFAVIQLLRLANILRILLFVLILAREILFSGLFSLLLGGLSLQNLFFYIMLLILFFDLIFLYFLLSYKVDINKGVNNDNPANSER